MPKRKLTPEAVDQILTEWETSTATEIAEKWGISPYWVNKLAQQHKKRKKAKICPQDMPQVLADISRLPIKEVARKWGVSANRIWAIAKKHSIPTVRSYKKIDPLQAQTLRREGKSLREIGRELGCSHERVRQLLTP